jgi:predicted TPR repeat methyltransferase
VRLLDYACGTGVGKSFSCFLPGLPGAGLVGSQLADWVGVNTGLDQFQEPLSRAPTKTIHR